MSTIIRARITPFGQVASLKSGAYGAIGTAGNASSSFGNGTLRVAPITITRSVTLTRLGIQVTVIGDVGSTVRLGIYADDGSLYPGALILDAGTIAGDSATLQEITISQTLSPGVYWFGGVVQNVVTTQPTLRAVSGALFSTVDNVAANVSNSGNISQSMTGVTGALPSTFSSTPTVSNITPRLIWKVA